MDQIMVENEYIIGKIVNIYALFTVKIHIVKAIDPKKQ